MQEWPERLGPVAEIIPRARRPAVAYEHYGVVVGHSGQRAGVGKVEQPGADQIDDILLAQPHQNVALLTALDDFEHIGARPIGRP